MTTTPGADTPVLRVRDLTVHFALPRRRPFAPVSYVHAVDGISFDVPRGTTFGLVGESGSGKSTAAQAIMRLIDPKAGTIELEGVDITSMKGEALRKMRRHFQIVFQDPYSSLNPRRSAGAVVREALDLLDVGNASERDDRVAELFQAVGLRPEQRVLFPHQFSGGQRQRIGIARALASNPSLIVCDEPVSALDVAIQAQILNLLVRSQQQFKVSYVFIAHDLGVVQHMCDEIGVMYLGQIVERGNRQTLFRRPLHPYTNALLAAVPSADPDAPRSSGQVQVSGDPPSPIDPPEGCRFAPRCPFAEDRCRIETPRLRFVGPDRQQVACHLVDDDGSAPHARQRTEAAIH
jgi:peptide/nickel transport system ATP-binding protein